MNQQLTIRLGFFFIIYWKVSFLWGKNTEKSVNLQNIHTCIICPEEKLQYSLGGVMVSVLAWSVVDRGFETRSGQTKDYNIGICCFSAKPRSIKKKEQRLVGSESGWCVRVGRKMEVRWNWICSLYKYNRAFKIMLHRKVVVYIKCWKLITWNSHRYLF